MGRIRKALKSGSQADSLAQVPSLGKCKELCCRRYFPGGTHEDCFGNRGSVQPQSCAVLVLRKCHLSKCSSLKINPQGPTALVDTRMVVSSGSIYSATPNCLSLADPSLGARFAAASLSWMLSPMYHDA